MHPSADRVIERYRFGMQHRLPELISLQRTASVQWQGAVQHVAQMDFLVQAAAQRAVLGIAFQVEQHPSNNQGREEKETFHSVSPRVQRIAFSKRVRKAGVS